MTEILAAAAVLEKRLAEMAVADKKRNHEKSAVNNRSRRSHKENGGWYGEYDAAARADAKNQERKKREERHRANIKEKSRAAKEKST